MNECEGLWLMTEGNEDVAGRLDGWRSIERAAAVNENVGGTTVFVGGAAAFDEGEEGRGRVAVLAGGVSGVKDGGMERGDDFVEEIWSSGSCLEAAWNVDEGSGELKSNLAECLLVSG